MHTAKSIALCFCQYTIIPHRYSVILFCYMFLAVKGYPARWLCYREKVYCDPVTRLGWTIALSILIYPSGSINKFFLTVTNRFTIFKYTIQLNYVILGHPYTIWSIQYTWIFTLINETIKRISYEYISHVWVRIESISDFSYCLHSRKIMWLHSYPIVLYLPTYIGNYNYRCFVSRELRVQQRT
jgi:hypothetical protein